MLREYNIVIMGGGGVGKSSLTVRFVHSLFLDKYDPTVEDSYRKTTNIDGTAVQLNIMDTAGTEQFMALQSMYFSSGDGFLLVFSLTSIESLHDLHPIRDQIGRKEADQGGRRVPLVLVGNKCDLHHERQVPREAAINLARQWRCPYYESSARTQVNVDEVFHDCARQMIQAGQGAPQRRQPQGRRSRKCTVL